MCTLPHPTDLVKCALLFHLQYLQNFLRLKLAFKAIPCTCISAKTQDGKLLSAALFFQTMTCPFARLTECKGCRGASQDWSDWSSSSPKNRQGKLCLCCWLHRGLKKSDVVARTDNNEGNVQDATVKLLALFQPPTLASIPCSRSAYCTSFHGFLDTCPLYSQRSLPSFCASRCCAGCSL